MQLLRDVVVDESFPLASPGALVRSRFAHDLAPYITRLPLSVGREVFLQRSETGFYSNVDYYALRLIRAGRGIQVVNGHPYSLTRGDIYITPLNAVHGYRDCHQVEMDAFYFQSRLFSREELRALQSMKGFWRLFVSPKRRGKRDFPDHRLHLLPQQYREVESIIDTMRAEICDPAPIGLVAVRNRFFCLLATLARWQEEGSGPAAGDAVESHAGESRAAEYRAAESRAAESHAGEMSGLIEYCERNFHRPLSVPELAARLWLSPDHFARLFARQTGMPPATYIRRLRLERAQQLLRTSDAAIPEIAAACGFNNGAALTRAFNATFGTTPSEYRRAYHASQTLDTAKIGWHLSTQMKG